MTPYFVSELRDLLNTHNVDTACNMSDLELADYLVDVLNTLKSKFEPHPVDTTHVDGVKPISQVNGFKSCL